jgi:hypothetical protein
MTNYEPRTTQENQILDLLRERRGAGVYSYELAEASPKGLGILQYNARIFGLRHKGHEIVSDFKGHYIIRERNQPMTQEELNQKLADLRVEWQTAGSGLKKLIQVRADLLKKRFAEQNETKDPIATAEFIDQTLNHEEK